MPLVEIKPGDESISTAMFRNARLRLLLTLVGLERLGVEDVLGASWAVPSALKSSELQDVKSILDKGLENPIKEIDGIDPREQLRRKATAEPRETYQTTLDVNFGSDSEGEDIVPDGPLFPPNIRSRSNALEQLKKSRRKRRQRDDGKEPLDEETLEERRRNREENAREKQAKIKSDLFIHASDDDSDEEADREFFEREEAGRKAQAQRIREALVSKALNEEAAEKIQSQKKGRKRRSVGEEDDHNNASDPESRKRRRSVMLSVGGVDSDDDILMTGLSENQNSPRQTSTSPGDGDNDTPPTSAEDEFDLDDDLLFNKTASTAAAPVNMAESDHDDAPVAPSRRRIRAGFVIDSDSE